jgi:hypothetical protein
MKKPMWDAKAVKAYETGQGVELVNEPHPHYEPKQMTGKQPLAPWNTTPPQRTWVGLTDEEIEIIYAECNVWDKFEYERMIEAKLKEKNT